MKTSDLKHFAYGRARRRKDNDHQSIQNMRAAGFAVVVIEPKDLGDVDPRKLEAEILSTLAACRAAVRRAELKE